MTGGEALVRLLEQYGVDTVFGIPGVHTLEIYRGLARSSIRHVTPRHEQSAGFMADAWARVSGRPGVCVVITGPGLTNVLNPVAQAYHDSVPLLVLSSVTATADRGKGYGLLHDLPDQRALTASITAFSHTVSHASELSEVLARAWEVFEGGRPRPVHVEVPLDVLSARASVPKRAAPPSGKPPAPSEASLARAGRILAGARQPLLVLGGGGKDAGKEALALAERLGAPILLTVNSKGSVPDRHPLCLGATMPFPPVLDAIEEADAVLAIGTELNEAYLYGIPRPARLQGKLIRVDIDRDQLRRRYRASVGLQGDAAHVARRLLHELRQLGPRPDGRERADGIRRRLRWPNRTAPHRAVLDALHEALPEDRIVASDSTQLSYTAHHYLPAFRPRSWLASLSWGTLGCGLPMAIGGKLAAPDRPVVCLAGDGGIQLTIAELATAADLRLSLPVVVWNNGGYGEIRDAMDKAGIPHIGTDITARDFLALARGFGCRGARARDLGHLRSLLRRALAARVPTLIEVREEAAERGAGS